MSTRPSDDGRPTPGSMTSHSSPSPGELARALRAAQAPTIGAVRRSNEASAASWARTKQMAADQARRGWVEDLAAIMRATHRGLPPVAVANRLRSLVRRVEAGSGASAEPCRLPQREPGCER